LGPSARTGAWIAAGKSLWIVTDGFYAKRPVMKFPRTAGVVLVNRLRKDAALCALPPKLKKGQPRGWQSIECLHGAF
jgi:hypothetical protein